MITVVLVNMLSHFYLLVDALYLAIDCGEQLLVGRRRREQLDDLQHFDLQPWARRHVVEVILCMLLHIRKYRHKLR